MTDISVFHVKTVRAGEHDFAGHDAHSRVHHDGSTYYYDLTGMGVSEDEFLAFVEAAWEADEDRQVTVEVYDAERGVFRAWVD